jgi:hypothetical protein
VFAALGSDGRFAKIALLGRILQCSVGGGAAIRKRMPNDGHDLGKSMCKTLCREESFVRNDRPISPSGRDCMGPGAKGQGEQRWVQPR